MSYILNPNTNRMIKVGGKPWRELVKSGIIANDPISPAIVELPKSTMVNIAPEQSAKADFLPVKVPLRERDARKSGKYYIQNRTGKDGKKKEVKVQKRAKQEEIADYTASCASRTLHKHMDALSDQLENYYGDENGDLSSFEENLKNLILEEMLTGEANKAPNRYMNETRRKKVDNKQQIREADYAEEEEEEYYEEEE